MKLSVKRGCIEIFFKIGDQSPGDQFRKHIEQVITVPGKIRVIVAAKLMIEPPNKICDIRLCASTYPVSISSVA